MGCEACKEADKDPLTPLHEACLDCAARALAWTNAYAESAKAGKLTPGYRNALEQVFIDDIATWHAKVKIWADRIAKAKEVQGVQGGVHAVTADAVSVRDSVRDSPRTKGKRKAKEG